MAKKNKLVKSWVNRHVNDHYVQMAQVDGYRSRAAYKLAEIDKEINLLKNINDVLDLGCAPGSWLQYLSRNLGQKANIIGVDLLMMEKLPNVTFIKGDFTDNNVLDQILTLTKLTKFDLVLSDMSPNISGIKSVDQSRIALLIELILEFCESHLQQHGSSLIKAFQGGEITRLVKLAKMIFNDVVIKKPLSSRSESSEIYLLCKDKKF